MFFYNKNLHSIVFFHSQAGRTNDDPEEWHRRLNHVAGKSTLPLYFLIQLLEWSTYRPDSILARSCDVSRRNRLRFQGQFFTVWEGLGLEKVSARNALNKISRMQAAFQCFTVPRNVMCNVTVSVQWNKKKLIFLCIVFYFLCIYLYKLSNFWQDCFEQLQK